MRQKAVTKQNCSKAVMAHQMSAASHSVNKKAKVCMQHMNYMQKLVDNRFSLRGALCAASEVPCLAAFCKTPVASRPLLEHIWAAKA